MMIEVRRLTTADRSRSARIISGTITARQPSSMACVGVGVGGWGGKTGGRVKNSVQVAAVGEEAIRAT